MPEFAETEDQVSRRDLREHGGLPLGVTRLEDSDAEADPKMNRWRQSVGNRTADTFMVLNPEEGEQQGNPADREHLAEGGEAEPETPTPPTPFDAFLAQKPAAPAPTAFDSFLADKQSEAQKPATPFDQFLAAKSKDPSMLESASTGFLHGVVPALTGVAGIGTGMAIGAFGGPAAPVTVPLGGLIGAGIGSYVGSKAQDAALGLVPESAKEKVGLSEKQLEAAQRAHPYATMVGEFGPALATFSPFGAAKALPEGAGAVARAMSSPVGSRVAGAGLMGGIESGQEYAQTGTVDPTKTAIAAGAGALMTKATPFGEKLTGLGEAPVRALTGARPIMPPPAEPAPAPSTDASGTAAKPTSAGTRTADDYLNLMKKSRQEMAHADAGLEAVRGTEGYVPDGPVEQRLIVERNKAEARFNTAYGELDKLRPEILGQNPEGRTEETLTPDEIIAREDAARTQRGVDAETQAKVKGEFNFQRPPPTPAETTALETMLRELRSAPPDGQLDLRAEPITDAEREQLETKLAEMRAANPTTVGPLGLQGETNRAPQSFTEEDWAKAKDKLLGTPRSGKLPLFGTADKTPPVWTDEDFSRVRAAHEAAQADRTPAQSQMELIGTAQAAAATEDDAARLAAQRWAREGIAAPSQPDLLRQRQEPDAGAVAPETARATPAETPPELPPNASSFELQSLDAALASTKTKTPVGDAYADVPIRPLSLTEFLASQGGIRDDGGELAQIIDDPKYRPLLRASNVAMNKRDRFTRLVNPKGLPLDDAALRAQELGYFPDRPDPYQDRITTNDLLDAIAAEMAGNKRFSFRDEGMLAAHEDARDRNSEIARLESRFGLDARQLSKAQFWDAVTEAMSLHDAALEADSRAEATLDAHAAAEQAAKQWFAERGDAWAPDDVYEQGQPRSLEDLENDFRQAEAAASVEPSPRRSGQSEPAVPDQGAVQAGAGQRGSGAGTPERGGEEATTDQSADHAAAAQELAAAQAAYRAAWPIYNKAREDYQYQRIDDAAFLAARKSFEAIRDRLDRAEGNPGATDITDQGEQRALPGAERAPEPQAAAETLSRKEREDHLRAVTFQLTPEVPKTRAGPELPLGTPADQLKSKIDRLNDLEQKNAEPEGGGDFFQRKAEEDNKNGPIKLESPRQEQEQAPPFFSALTRAVEAIPQPKAPGPQWANMIRNLTNKGVKQDEIDWSGVLDWLKDHPGLVTKDQLLEQLRLNEVNVQDVTRGRRDMTMDERRPLLDWITNNLPEKRNPYGSPGADEMRDLEARASLGKPDAIERLQDWGIPDSLIAPYRVAGGPTKYAGYTLPGGSNYREMLLTWPAGAVNEAARAEVYNRFQPQIDAARTAYDKAVGRADHNEVLALHENIDRLQRERDQAAHDAGYREITHDKNHWNTENVLAHVRFDDRTDAEGRKVLHIAEIQSDWGQQGRRNGFRDTAAVEAAAKRAGDALKHAREVRDEANPQIEALSTFVSNAASDTQLGRLGRWYAEGEDGRHLFESADQGAVERWMLAHRDQRGKLGYDVDGTDPRVQRYRRRLEQMRDLEQRIQDADRAYYEADQAHHDLVQSQYKAPPQMPLATQWHEMALKRILRFASENGYDRVSWDTGDTQADRYDLSKQVSGIKAYKRADGSYNLSARRQGDSLYATDIAENVPEAKLADYVGKELADKIAKQDPGESVYSGLDLKVGGEGMRGFYDRILPAFANKYAKKFGAKVERGAVTAGDERAPYEAALLDTPSGSRWHVLDKDGQSVVEHDGGFDAREAAEEQAERWNRLSTKPAHQIDITPQMHESVMQGQPLWQGEANASGAGYRNLSQDFTKFAAEKGAAAGGAKPNEIARDYVLARGQETGNEHAVVLSGEHGVVAVTTSDSPFEVHFDTPLARVANSGITTHHNHERLASNYDQPLAHSSADAATLAYPGIDRSVVHDRAPDGTAETYTAEATPTLRAWRNMVADGPQKLQQLYLKTRQVVMAKLDGVTRLSDADRVRLLPDITMRSLDAAGAVRYSGPYGHDPLPNVLRNAIIRSGAEAASGNARRVGLPLRSGDEINANLHQSTKPVLSADSMDRVHRAHEQDQANAAARGPADRAGGDQGRAADAEAGTEARAASGEGGVGLRSGEPPGPPAPPPPKPPGAPEEPSWFERAALAMGRGTASLRNNMQMWLTPMALGSDVTRAINKDFASSERLAAYQTSRFIKMMKPFKQEELTGLYETMDRASVEAQLKGDAAGKTIIDALPKPQRELAYAINDYGDSLWEAGRAEGSVSPDAVRIPWYVPRMIVGLEKPGEAGYLLGTKTPFGEGNALDRLGINLTTAGPRRRQFLTAEETEAAAKAKFGDTASLVRDIRTLPLALERFARGIAGRRLVNEIRRIGASTGEELVREGVEGPGYFTIDHPALKNFRTRRGDDGAPLRDEHGDYIWDRQPLFISKRFEGPMRAVLRTESPNWIKAFNSFKAGVMQIVMPSPFIHLQVELGRAFPAVGGKMATWSFWSGANQALNNPEIMERAIRAGYAPISGRGMTNDLPSIANSPWMRPGSSVPAKIARTIGDQWSTNTGNAIAHAIDVAGETWHQRLLWDQVAKLQMGIYLHKRSALIAQGLDPIAAEFASAHAANRFAGTLPHEAMSEFATRLGNLGLFSRTFSLGNLGVLKDAFLGLPRDVQSQMSRHLDELMTKKAVSASRRTAISAILLDVGLFYLLNAAAQTGFSYLNHLGAGEADPWGSVSREYDERLRHVMQKAGNNPIEALDPFLYTELLPQSQNEPSKSDRVLVGNQQDKTQVYARLPSGKIGEEFLGYGTHFAEMVRRKLSTLAHPLLSLVMNDSGFGKKAYNPDPHGLGEYVEVLGDVAKTFLSSQIPETQVSAMKDIVTGDDRSMLAVGKALGPMLGFTIGRGAPGALGGPDFAYEQQVKKQFQFRLQKELPGYQKMVKAGDLDDAYAGMQKLGMTGKEITSKFRYWLSTDGRALRPADRAWFNKHATEEQKYQMEHLNRATP